MKLLVKKGRTSLLVRIFIQDSSSSTGAGLTGLTSGSAGLVCYRARDDDGNAAATQVTLSAGTRGTWSSGGFVEKDATNMPGVYELGLPNAGQATGSESVTYMLKGATNMAPLALEIQLVAYDPQDAAALGLTDIDATISSRMATFTLPANFATLSIDATGRVDLGKILGTASAGQAGAIAPDWAQVKNPTTALDLTQTTIKNLDGNTVQTGDAFARLGAPAGASVSADIAAVKADTGTILTDVNTGAGAIYNRIGAPAGASVSADIAAVKASVGTPMQAGAVVAITSNIKKNQATAGWSFLITDSTNHNPMTGAVILTATRSIDGGAFAAGTLSAVTEVGAGIYTINLAAGDLNGNVVTLRVTATGADDVLERIVTQP